MCGLAGWQLTEEMPENMKIVNAVLCHCSADRGEDSWGVLQGTNVVKGLGSIAQARYTRKMHRHPSIAMHSRLATTGARTVENSHPFSAGNIVGMHNGIIYNHHSLNSQYNRRAEVDSQHIFEHINAGLDMKDLEGYGAIVYIKRDTPGQYFMGRFNTGELSIARILKHGKRIGVMWASTRKAVTNAASLAGLDIQFVLIVEDKLYRVADGEVFDTDEKIGITRNTVTKSAEWEDWEGYNFASGRYASRLKSAKDESFAPFKYSGNGYSRSTKNGGTSWRASTLDSEEEDETAEEKELRELRETYAACDSCGEIGNECMCDTGYCYCAHCVRRIDAREEKYRDDKRYEELFAGLDKDTPPTPRPIPAGWTEIEPAAPELSDDELSELDRGDEPPRAWDRDGKLIWPPQRGKAQPMLPEPLPSGITVTIGAD